MAKSPKTKKYEFQAEVKQVLDIVINSLYTHREIFVRELISNAADAIEKLKFETLTEKEYADSDLPLEIRININEEEKSITFSDTGIGMTQEEIVENIGTIAHSGSKSFLSRLAEASKTDTNIIGQFGVGFYSVFMAAQRVEMRTKSMNTDAPGCLWKSDATGTYTIEHCDDIKRGTAITAFLKEDAHEFANADKIKDIIKKYSNFVAFSIYVNDEKINTVQAIWTKNKKDITTEEYSEFYKFVANAWDDPMLTFHFNADAPVDIKSILFVPKDNIEKLGFGKSKPGVNLYCKKILISHSTENFLPEWLRFVKGIVDSEDLPLNISRETMQNNTLVAKLRKVITSKFIKFLEEQSNKDEYKEFYKNFGIYLKEGIINDFENRAPLTKLLRFETSKGENVSFSDYVKNMKDTQTEIYYINGPTKESIENGPYIEAFKERDIEVIYTHEPVDDFVMTNVGEFEGKRIVSIDQADITLPETDKKDETADALPDEQVKSLSEWLKKTLSDRVNEVYPSKKLVSSPAMLVNPAGGMTSSMERVMQAINKGMPMGSKKNLEINPSHKIIKNLDRLRENDADFAKIVAEQIYDNALISAGLLDDPREMVNRIYTIIEKSIDEK